MMNKGNIFIISGPSGAGKSTVLKFVLESIEKPFFSVSCTTRAPRTGEIDGVHYHFISRDKFISMIENGEFIEYAEYAGNFYGTPLKPIYESVENGCDVFLDVEVKGKKQVSEKVPEAVSVFIAPPSLEELENRLRLRATDTEEAILLRLKTAGEELALADTYDHVVINDVAECAADEILGIIRAAKQDV